MADCSCHLHMGDSAALHLPDICHVVVVAEKNVLAVKQHFITEILVLEEAHLGTSKAAVCWTGSFWEGSKTSWVLRECVSLKAFCSILALLGDLPCNLRISQGIGRNHIQGVCVLHHVHLPQGSSLRAYWVTVQVVYMHNDWMRQVFTYKNIQLSSLITVNHHTDN